MDMSLKQGLYHMRTQEIKGWRGLISAAHFPQGRFDDWFRWFFMRNCWCC